MSMYVLIFIYSYVSICVVLFDLAFTYIQEKSDKKLYKRISIVKYNMGLNGIYYKNVMKKHDLHNLLCKNNYIVAFGEIINTFDNKDTELFDWANDNTQLIADIAKAYIKKPSEYRAYFAYILTKLPIATQSEAMNKEDIKHIKDISEIMVVQMRDQSVYLRENSFKALLKLGTARDILMALEIINDNLPYQNEKLLTDNLLRFEGIALDLVNGMWENFKHYTTTLQIVFINYMRLLPRSAVEQNKYFEEFFMLLNDENIHKEVKLAVIRYFRKYKYEPVYEKLVDMVNNYSDLNWEYAAVSATSLVNYPSERTVEALKKAVISRNWYLRFNASESLIGLGEDCHAMLEAIKDSYAGEMLEYRLKVHEMKMKGVNCING